MALFHVTSGSSCARLSSPSSVGVLDPTIAEAWNDGIPKLNLEHIFSLTSDERSLVRLDSGSVLVRGCCNHDAFFSLFDRGCSLVAHHTSHAMEPLASDRIPMDSFMMAAAGPGLSVADAFSSRSSEWDPLLTAEQCFLSVFDINSKKNLSTVHVAPKTEPDKVKDVLDDLPEQPEDMIRFYVEEFALHASPSAAASFQDHVAKVISDDFAQSLSGGSSSRGYEALCSQWRSDHSTTWYETEAYDVPSLTSTSAIKPYFVRARGAAALSAHLIRSLKRLCITSALGLSSVPPGNAGFASRFKRKAFLAEQALHQLTAFTEALLQSDVVQGETSRKDLSDAETKQYLLLRLYHAMLGQYSTFANAIEQRYVRPRRAIMNPKSSALQPWLLSEITADAYHNENFSEAASELSSAARALTDLFAINATSHGDKAGDRKFATEVYHLCNNITDVTSRISAGLEAHLKFLELSRTIQETDGVRILGILASIFLPLSLGTGILSMQTRFVDLHLLLYDFVGVVVLIATLAILVVSGLKGYGHIRQYIDQLKTGTFLNALRSTGMRLWLFVMRQVLWLSWLLLLASFLVGMIKDVILGLKILGYGAASIVGLQIVGLGLWKFGSLFS